MKVAIITIDGPDRHVGLPHIQNTLNGMFAADGGQLQLSGMLPVHVFVTGTDASFLGPWRNDSRVSVHTQTPAEHADFLCDAPFPRMARVTGRALAACDDSVLFFEDDVQFAQNWMKKTGDALDTLRVWRQLEHTVLALYSPHLFNGGPIVKYTEPFYGQQGLFLGREVCRKLVMLLENERSTASDVVMHALFQRDPSIGVYCMVPNVIQHVGRVSIAKAAWFHQSPTFQP